MATVKTLDRPTPPSMVRWRFHAVGSLLLSVGLHVCTSSAFVGVVLPSAHAGWNSLRTGSWLLHSDPRRRRARICFAFYLATACWKAAAAAFLTVLLLMMVAAITGKNPNIDNFMVTMLMLAGGAHSCQRAQSCARPEAARWRPRAAGADI